MKKRLNRTFILMIVTFFTLTMFCNYVFANLPEGVPSSLEAPSIKKIELKTNEDGIPYFEAQVKIPQSILDLDREQPAGGSVFWEYSIKLDNGSWEDFGGGGYLSVITEAEEAKVAGSDDTFIISFSPIDEGGLEEINIENHIYSYKIRFYYDYYEGWPNVEPIYSPISNEMSIGSGSFYKVASSWATAELDKAQQYGLITERIKDDMTAKVTREEFAEIAVKLYEIYTGNTATVGNSSFTDTTNPEILKAANLGLVTGVGNNKYEPNALVTREQMATILLRALKVINPTADFSTTNPTKFADDEKVESWAKDGVYYCSKTKIVAGIGNNLFDPKGSATREMAVIVCTRAYEFYK